MTETLNMFTPLDTEELMWIDGGGIADFFITAGKVLLTVSAVAAAVGVIAAAPAKGYVAPLAIIGASIAIAAVWAI